MNKNSKSEKYRKLSITSLVIGIVALLPSSYAFLGSIGIWLGERMYGDESLRSDLNILYGFIFFAFIMGIIAIILDLLKIKESKIFIKGSALSTPFGLVAGIVIVIINVISFFLITGDIFFRLFGELF